MRLEPFVYTDAEIEDPDEQVKRVDVVISNPDGTMRPAKRYVVADTFYRGMYRSDSPAGSITAWTRSLYGAKWHKTHEAAEDTLREIRQERREDNERTKGKQT